MRGTLRCRDNARPKISMLTPLGEPSFSLERINLPPFTYQMEAQKFEKRLPAAQRYIVEHGLNEHHHGNEPDVGIVMQGGLWNTTLGGLRRFLTAGGLTSRSATEIDARYAALTAHRTRVRSVLPQPVAKRPPSFCTGCPERPVFSALKILRQREPAVGDTHVAADIGCSTFSTQAPFNVGNSVLGYGMGLADALRGLGVKWIRTVNSYRIAEVIRTLREALTTRVPGLKVIIARNECMLERQRREKPRVRQAIAAGAEVVQPRFGVDPDVCTGDHSCMRLNGCPSLTLRENPDPLREDPIAHVDETCVGCGVCGEVAHAAVLCPSFYEVNVIANPTRWTRFVARVRRAVIGRLAAVTA